MEFQKVHRIPPFKFFGRMRLFQNSYFLFFFENFLKNFSNFSKCLRRVPSFFSIFCNKLDFQKAERGPLFTILKPLGFLSLRYSANFGRFRLVSYQLGSSFESFQYPQKQQSYTAFLVVDFCRTFIS